MNSFTFKMKENLLGNPHYPCVYYKGVLGTKPSLILFYQSGVLTIKHATELFELTCPPKQALEFLEELLENQEPQEHNQLMGFFGFEFGLRLLNLKVDETKKPLIPEFYFILPTELEFFDQEFNSLQKIKVSSEKPIIETPSTPYSPSEKQKFKSNLNQKKYDQALAKIKQLIIEGQTYQVNFAQRFHGTSTKTPIQLFSELAVLNPSPHQALLHTADFSIISNSPESLYIKQKDTLKTYPIKGTLKANLDPQILLDSKKDQAELEMIVDLERNDLGKIALSGTVKVTKHRYIESYNNVHHTLSEITCQLPPKTKFSQIFQSLFPGGSITGCPKVRTSKFIHQLEPDLREYYCGSLGIIRQNGDSEFNILIRSILNIGNDCYFHSGGGITIQSVDSAEYTETLDKAANLIKVLSTD